jgi:hypothetical protein
MANLIQYNQKTEVSGMTVIIHLCHSHTFGAKNADNPDTEYGSVKFVNTISRE